MKQIQDNKTDTITSIIRRLSDLYSISASTLKSNSRVLRDLGLISFGNNLNYKKAKMTDFGKFVLSIIGEEEDEWG